MEMNELCVIQGSEVALEAASVILMRDNLTDVLTAIDLSRAVFRRIRFNYIWAVGVPILFCSPWPLTIHVSQYNTLAIPLASGALFPFLKMVSILVLLHLKFGFKALHPAVAGLCMALSSVSVVVSSLMLKSYRPPLSPTVKLFPLSPMLVIGCYLGTNEASVQCPRRRGNGRFWWRGLGNWTERLGKMVGTETSEKNAILTT